MVFPVLFHSQGTEHQEASLLIPNIIPQEEQRTEEDMLHMKLN